MNAIIRVKNVSVRAGKTPCQPNQRFASACNKFSGNDLTSAIRLPASLKAFGSKKIIADGVSLKTAREIIGSLRPDCCGWMYGLCEVEMVRLTVCDIEEQQRLKASAKSSFFVISLQKEDNNQITVRFHYALGAGLAPLIYLTYSTEHARFLTREELIAEYPALSERLAP